MRYEVCISFAGTNRKYAEKLAVALRNAGIRVFYDEFEQARLWGTFLHDSLGKIYAYDSFYCIVLLSADYYQKMYTNVERRSLLIARDERRQDYILPIRMDSSKIPIELQGISYLSPKTPRAITKLLIEKLSLQRETLVGGMFEAMSYHRFEEAIVVAAKYLDSYKYKIGKKYDPKFGVLIGICLFNIACCCSRMLADERKKSKHPQLLKMGLQYLKQWILDENLRSDFANVADALLVVNDDDDLLTLRNVAKKELRACYSHAQKREKEILAERERVRLNLKATGRNGGGCVEGATMISTTTGLRRADAIDRGDIVRSYDEATSDWSESVIRSTQATKVDATFIINEGLTVSLGQRLHERSAGWLAARELQVGMFVLHEVGYMQVRSIVLSNAPAQVYALSLAGNVNTFVANGYVCHNIK